MIPIVLGNVSLTWSNRFEEALTRAKIKCLLDLDHFSGYPPLTLRPSEDHPTHPSD